MPILDIISILLVLAATFGVLNHFIFQLPQSIGIMVVALLASLGVMIVGDLVPALDISESVRHLVNDFEFSGVLLEGMLGLLLFAGSLHVSIPDLRKQALPILLMATLGVALSAAIFGFGISWVTGMPILVALVFGVLISPTDPVAVLGVLRAANLRKSLETKIAGESLFNDGVAYVGYLVLVAMAFPHIGDGHASGIEAGAKLFVQEALGGAVLGAALGWTTFQIMRRIDDYALEVLITLALAFGGYTLAVNLHLSGPIFAVVSGLFIGHIGMRDGMSEHTRSMVDKFWAILDELLNSVLFLMIGFEVFAPDMTGDVIMLGLLAVVLALVARLAAVAVPIMILRPFRAFDRDVIPVLWWGGLKGGISIALALSLPDSEWKTTILGVTYVVVIFSIIVQGLTVSRVAKTLAPKGTAS